VQCFDYRDANVAEEILRFAEGEVKFVLDCIGSKEGSVEPIARIVERGPRVAVLLPVVVREASEAEAPVYEMDVQTAAEWDGGVDVRGVRTHFYLEVCDSLQC
jgi:hypothetical protein